MSVGAKKPVLVVMPSRGVLQRSGEGWRIPGRWLEGMREYDRLWDGEVRVLAHGIAGGSFQLDRVGLSEFPFPIDIDPDPGKFAASLSTERAVVLASSGSTGFRYVRALLSREVPVVLDIVNSRKTQLDIIAATVPNPLRRWKRYLNHLRYDRALRALIRETRGVQLKGIASGRSYAALSRSPLSYFDNRMRRSDLASAAHMEKRFERFAAGGTLNLVFAGRLDRIKGVGDLPHILRQVRDLGVDARLDVCGDGPEMQRMRELADRLELNESITFHGSLSQETEFYPLLRETADLFVCTHHQGDPSHVYLEVMCAGVTPVGYANETLAGLRQLHGIGECVPMKRRTELAKLITRIARSPDQARAMAVRSLEFGARHNFSETWPRRIEHLVSCL